MQGPSGGALRTFSPRWWRSAPLPGLCLAQQRKTHETTDLQLLTVVGQAHLHRVDFAGGRVEDLAALPLVASARDTPHHDHAFNRLILAVAVAFGALR